MPIAENRSTECCPSCERYIGPADVCPYCDCDSARPFALKILRRISGLLAITGIICLYIAARFGTNTPEVEAGSLTPMMNFACVRVSGRVVRNAYLGEDNDIVSCLSFFLDDGTGEVRVAAYGQVACDLAAGRVPAAGDILSAEGPLTVTAEGKPRLRLRATDCLAFRREAAR